MNCETNAYVIEKDPKYNVPTEELLRKFPIIYPTPASTPLAKKIQNRMLNGFNTWNMGFDAWEHWGEVFYHKDSLYNVHGVHFTLQEYQKAMNAALMNVDIQMGDFQNMIFNDDWTAIRYQTFNIDRKTGRKTPAEVTEFVRFGDYGDLGAKVEEGWGGVKCGTFAGFSSFQTEEERKAERKFLDELISTRLKDTDNLEEKYPVCYPTQPDSKDSARIKEILLKEIECKNQGEEAYTAWIDQFLTNDAMFELHGRKMDPVSLKKELPVEMKQHPVTVRINNLLISQDWAAVHYWEVITKEDGSKDVNNHMNFYHFINTANGLSADMIWEY